MNPVEAFPHPPPSYILSSECCPAKAARPPYARGFVSCSCHVRVMFVSYPHATAPNQSEALQLDAPPYACRRTRELGRLIPPMCAGADARRDLHAHRFMPISTQLAWCPMLSAILRSALVSGSVQTRSPVFVVRRIGLPIRERFSPDFVRVSDVSRSQFLHRHSTPRRSIGGVAHCLVCGLWLLEERVGRWSWRERESL